jgi:hypothetical protein
MTDGTFRFINDFRGARDVGRPKKTGKTAKKRATEEQLLEGRRTHQRTLNAEAARYFPTARRT